MRASYSGVTVSKVSQFSILADNPAADARGVNGLAKRVTGIVPAMEHGHPY